MGERCDWCDTKQVTLRVDLFTGDNVCEDCIAKYVDYRFALRRKSTVAQVREELHSLPPTTAQWARPESTWENPIMNGGELKEPEWYDKSKLRRAYYAEGYSGWVVDLGDGTCRFANAPLLGDDGPNWGDRVRLVEVGYGLPIVDVSEILERYVT